jgi:hypothetical protein
VRVGVRACVWVCVRACACVVAGVLRGASAETATCAHVKRKERNERLY